MAQPKWNTNAGDLGTFTTINNIDILLSAFPEYPATEVSYILLNGELPKPLVLTIHGRIIGKPDIVNDDKTYTFTVRAFDNFGQIRDRTFYMTIQGAAQPKFNTVQGNILTIYDSTWIEYQLEYSEALDPTSTKISISGGKLPPGLELSSTGLIRGYCKPPLTAFNGPTTTVYKFTTKLINDLGYAQASYSITVQNYNIAHSTNSRIPTILNKRPLSFTIPTDDRYYTYYLPNSKLPVHKSGDYFAFKVIGYDFDKQDIQYEFYELPPGLTGNTSTGWITGYPILSADSIHSYDFRVRTKKKSVSTTGIATNFFNGDGTKTKFTLTKIPVNSSYVKITIDGLRPENYRDPNNPLVPAPVTWSLDKSVITFSPAPKNNAEIVVTIFGTAPDIYSPFENFIFTISKNVNFDIVWKTPSNLGTIYNNTVSDLSVLANSKFDLEYRVVDGSLPPNLILYSNGEIGGKVPNQPTTKFLNVGDETVFTFSVEAYSPKHALLSSIQTFTLTVEQYYGVPTETMYFKATPNLSDRAIINSLLTDTTLIPNESLYRAEDQYFGKAKDVRFVQVYGIKAGTIEQYVSAININHYWRNITLGPLKTAVAKDDYGNVIYEVVYSEIIDDLANSKGEGPPKDLYWGRTIYLDKGPWLDNENEIYTSYDNNNQYNVSLDPGTVSHVYPASFSNMRKQIADVLEENYDGKLLPRWMRSQQNNGSILGYVQAWVICYVKPGQSQTIVDNINNNWAHKLNKIYFEIDRYVVDKSSTFDFNSYLTKPTWENLPSASPAPAELDAHDFYILFPRKTILPR